MDGDDGGRDDHARQRRARPDLDEGVAPEVVDDKYDAAVALVARLGQASASLMQRHLRIGYKRAARLIEAMEREGVVGPADGSRPRDVHIKDIPAPSLRSWPWRCCPLSYAWEAPVQGKRCPWRWCV